MVGRIVLGILLGGVGTSAQYDNHAASRAFNRALGVECAYCHADPPPGEAERPRLVVARQMIAMVEEVNTRSLAGISGRISCWTCHAGQVVPSRLPRDAREKVLAAWPAGAAPASDAVKLRMAVYTASTGRTCAGCHENRGIGPATEEAETLVKVMTGLFPVLEQHLPATARTECFMCHKGRPHPLVAPGQ